MMNTDDIRAWLRQPTSISALPAGTTRGQALACMTFGTLAPALIARRAPPPVCVGHQGTAYLTQTTGGAWWRCSVCHTLLGEQAEPRNAWAEDNAWVVELARDLVELDPRLAGTVDAESVSAAVRTILSAVLCDGLSCPTR